MKLSEYTALDATGLAALVRSGDVSPGELVETALTALQQIDKRLHAVVDYTYDYAMEQLKNGIDKTAPFCGVPFVLKDCGGVAAGIRTTLGTRLSGSGVYAKRDSTLFERMRRAGVVVVATTTTSEFCMDSSTETLRHGPTRNPWNLSESAGGSSGGSAALVAAGAVPMAHGSDGGGSIRIPAAMCGVVGFKPSRFRIPTGPCGWDPGGTVQFVLSRTVRDSAAMLDATEGPDPGYYGAAAPHALPYAEAVKQPPRKLKIAYMTRTPYGKPFASPECVEAVLSTVDILRALGHTCVEAYPEIPEGYHDARVTYMNDGIALEIQLMAEETGRPIDETTLEPLVYKTYLDGLSRKGLEVFRARGELANAGREMGRFFQSYDLLLSPTCGRISRPLGTLNGVANSEISAFEWARRRRDYACITPLANVAGLPSISLPLCMSDSGLPIGIEIDGAIDQDELVLQLSAQLERAAPWSGRRPPIYASGTPSRQRETEKETGAVHHAARGDW